MHGQYKQLTISFKQSLSLMSPLVPMGQRYGVSCAPLNFQLKLIIN